MKLLGSASTLETLIQGIGKFYYSDNITLNEVDGVYEVHNLNGKINGVRVIKKKNRYRFESIAIKEGN